MKRSTTLSVTTTKEIWDVLTVAHDGTSNMKQTKINMIVTQYEMFKLSLMISGILKLHMTTLIRPTNS